MGNVRCRVPVCGYAKNVQRTASVLNIRFTDRGIPAADVAKAYASIRRSARNDMWDKRTLTTQNATALHMLDVWKLSRRASDNSECCTNVVRLEDSSAKCHT